MGHPVLMRCTALVPAKGTKYRSQCVFNAKPNKDLCGTHLNQLIKGKPVERVDPFVSEVERSQE